MSRAGLLRLTLTLAISYCGLQPAGAVPVTDVFAAEVDMPAGGGLQNAFDVALERVLVKATGSSAFGNSAARASLVRDSSALVSRYSTLADSRVRVEFDVAAVQAALDAAGQPVWGLERPLIALWYAADAGNGDRQLLGAAEAMGSPQDAMDMLRSRLLEVAAARGLPVVLPLLDGEDLARVSFADVWGEFEKPLREASQRYGADALLIGRSRTLDPDSRRVRWRLFTDNEMLVWEGGVDAGPTQAADYFAQTLATFAGAADQVRLRIGNIDTLSKYGQLRRYLLGLNVVAGASIVRVQEDHIEFDLTVRGDVGRLRQTLDSGGPLTAAEAATAAIMPSPGTRPPDLSYVWAEPR